MKNPVQLMHGFLASAVIASGLTTAAVIAGPLPSASAAVSTPSKVISVKHGAATAGLLTQGGDVYTFGDNTNGATGQGLTTGVTETPTKLATFAPAGQKVIQIAVAGVGTSGFGLALTDAGQVYSWGYDGQGALGNDAAMAHQATPVPVAATWGSDKPVYIASLAGGGRVVTESGRVYAWGYNEWGQTGIDNGGANIATPLEVTTLYRPSDKVVQITGGSAGMLARTASGLVFAAGSKARGQRGDGSSDPNNYSTYTPELSQLNFGGLAGSDSIVSIGSGTSYGFAVSGTGKVWGWGNSTTGRLGDGLGTHDQLTPLPIVTTLSDAGDTVVAVAMSGSANISMLRTAQGHLYTVGSGNNGMLGNGATTNTIAFAKITSWPGRGSNDPIVDGVVGASNSLAVTQNGSVYTWGNSLVTNQGGIGTGTQTPNVVSSPVVLTQPVVLVPFTDAVDASITGTVKVGQALTGSAGTYAPSDAVIGYQWKVGSDTVSSTSNYTPKLADAGKNLTLAVTGSKTGYVDSTSTTSNQSIATVQGFTGTLQAGQTLTASDSTGTNTWGLSASSSCTSPTTATGSTYALPSDSTGKYIQLSQTLSGRTGAGTCVGPIAAPTSPATITGAATASGIKGQTFTYTPSLGGTPAPTVTLTAGTLPAGVTLQASTGKLSGTPTVAGSFEVTLTATNGVGTAATKDVAITIDDVVTGLAPAIGGTPKVGVQLTATPGGSLAPTAGDGATVTYVWQHETAPGIWTDLNSGATYTPSASEVGQVYRVKVTVAKAGFQTRTEYSSATTAVVKGTFAIAAPSISGTTKVGETLTCAAAPGTPGTLSYAWTRGATALGSGTTYDLVAADRTETVTCTVTSGRTGYTDATGSVDSTTIGFGSFSIGAPSITGTAKVGETLTCVAASGTPGALSYAWIRDMTVLGSDATYDLVAADRTKKVTCAVRSVRAGYTDAVNSTDSPTVGTGSFSIAAPSITGTAKVGETLTCVAASGTPGALWYVWNRGATVLGSGATYDLVAADRTEKVTCTITSVRAGYSDATNAADSPTVGTGAFSIGAPSITGTAKVGETLTCVAASGTPGALSYAWTRGATVLGSGATYDLVAADRSEKVTCTVTSVRTGYADATNSQDSETIGLGSFSIGAPSIAGTAKVGERLTCAAAPGTLGDVSYAWSRGVTALGASATYDLVAADRTEKVTCTVTSVRTGYADATNSQDSETIGLGSFSIGAPSIAGIAKVGETLTCAAAPGTLGDVSYAWSRGVTALGASATYDLVAADRTEKVTCTVTAVRAGYADAANSVDSATVGTGSFTVDAPSIAGIAKVGETLTCAAAPGTLGDVSYAWSRGATALGAEASYELVVADRTEKVTCTVTSERAGYTDATNSVDSATVTYGSFSIGAPSIAGKVEVGQTLTCAAAPSTLGDVSYAWSRGATALGTGDTYKLAVTDKGHVVSCTVTSTRDGYNDATSRIATKAVSDKPAVKITGLKPRIVGKVSEGSTVTADAGKVVPSSAARTYQWFADGRKIKGATARTLKLRKPEAGRLVSVQVTARAGSLRATETSAARMVSSTKERLVIIAPAARGGKYKVTATGLTPGRRYTIWLAGQNRAAGVVGSSGTVSRTVTFGSKVKSGAHRVRVSTYKKSGKRTTTIVRVINYKRASR